jgi:hypothetical protein
VPPGKVPPSPPAASGRRAILGACRHLVTCASWSDGTRRSRSEIHNLWDAFFFSTVQLLTVSSQMRNPVTTGGRVVDIFLELTAICLVTGIAGAFASFFLELERDNSGDADHRGLT